MRNTLLVDACWVAIRGQQRDTNRNLRGINESGIIEMISTNEAKGLEFESRAALPKIASLQKYFTLKLKFLDFYGRLA